MYQSKFINYLEHEKRYSAHTIVAYQKDLEQFATFLEKHYELQDLLKAEFNMVRSWMASLMQQRLDERSVKRKLSSLKTFYKYLVRIGKLSVNPAAQAVAPKVKQKLPVFVNQKGMDQLFSSGLFEDDYAGMRDRLVLELLYATGMRLSELINVRRSDITKAATWGGRSLLERGLCLPRCVASGGSGRADRRGRSGGRVGGRRGSRRRIAGRRRGAQGRW